MDLVPLDPHLHNPHKSKIIKYRKSRSKKYDIVEKKSNLTSPYLFLNSLNGDELDIVGWDRWKLFLCFNYTITTNQFHGSIYRKLLSKDRIRLHEKIMILHNKGWGYTKIHRYLVQNGFKIGKSRTTVDSIIKKIKKRREFLSQPIIGGIGGFRVVSR